MQIVLRCALLGALLFFLVPASSAQDTRTVTEIAVEGEVVDLPGGGSAAITTIQSVLFTNRDSEVGFTLDVSGDDGVWFDDGVTWLNSQAAGFTLTGAEFTMGIGDDGEFIYSPSIDGDDGVWTDQGFLAAENQPAPGYGGDTLSTFHSRPTMDATGTAYWVAGINDGTTSTSTVNRALYMSTDRTPATISIVARSGDTYDGFVIDSGSSGIDFDYEFSNDGTQNILGLVFDTGSTTDDAAVGVNGSVVAREGQPNGTGDNWDNFDNLRVLDDGTYGWTGDTDGDTATDEFLSINGTILLREGDTVDGLALGSFVRGFDLNQNGTVVFGWTLTSSSDEGLFVADVSDVPGTATLIARTGDLLDTGDGGGAEWVITDINFSSGQGALSLSPDDVAFASLGVEPAGGGTEVDGAFAFDLGDGCLQDLTATLDNTTPAPGDVITFSVSVTNNDTAPAPLNLWLVATGPVNRTVRLGNGTVPAGATVSRDVSVRVPPQAPSGQYALDLNIGTFPDDICDTVAFTLDVQGTARAGAGTGTEFEALNDFFATAASAVMAEAPVVAPNPFARQTAIRFAIDADADVRLAIYDVLGREVAVLVDSHVKAGTHRADFDARGLAAGTYVYRLQVGNEEQTGRMTVVR